MTSHDVILDLSRLLSRVRHHTPSGVDRVEMAYARGLLHHFGDALQFAAVHPLGVYGRLPKARALPFLDAMEERWTCVDTDAHRRPMTAVLPELFRLIPERPPSAGQRVYVQASPHHLTKPALVRRILQREGARFLCLVHDLIPIEYPEYARPDGARLHSARIETVAALADSVIVNSSATGRSFAPWLLKARREVEIHVAHLGTQDSVWSCVRPNQGASPYFVCIGTIEPRKNHLLLLNLWRQMAETMDHRSIPRLIIIGRRGWENEQIVDMLERCAALRGHVEELNGCTDERLYTLLRGARALLLPSFAEGYGMPVAEALSVGTPVICSDLPALREAGGMTPDFLDPLDGPEWKAHILDYSMMGPLYLAQKHRLPQWDRPTWEAHIEIVRNAIERLRA